MNDPGSRRAVAPRSDAEDAASAAPRWFSENPSKAWGEKLFLAYSPIWMTMMGLVMVLGIDDRVGEWGFLAIGVAIATPLVVVPALIRDERYLGRRWYETYWFKANVYIGIFNFVANYFGSEYFFDVLGMVYDYPEIELLNLDSALVGTGEQQVPIMMYLLTQAFFMTYHSTAIVVLRRLRTSGLVGVKALWLPVVGVVAYFWAWMETRWMANPLIADRFYYRDMERMLAFGSMFYAIYFIASFPIFYHLDETRTADWTLTRTAGAACAAGLIMLLLLDFATKWFGPL